MLGHWANFEDIEEKLCLAELEAIVRAAREQESRRNKFAASLKGIDLDGDGEGEEEATTFEDVKRRAEAKLRGVPEEALELEEIGFTYEVE